MDVSLNEWELKHIQTWLHSLNLDTCYNVFTQNQFNGSLIIKMDELQINTLIQPLSLRHQIMLKSALLDIKKEYKLNNTAEQKQNNINNSNQQIHSDHNDDNNDNNNNYHVTEDIIDSIHGQKPEKFYKRWTKNEDKILLEYMYGISNDSLSSLTNKLQRTTSAINGRMNKLRSNMSDKYKQKLKQKKHGKNSKKKKVKKKKNKQKKKQRENRNENEDKSKGKTIIPVIVIESDNDEKDKNENVKSMEEQKKLLKLRLFFKKLRFYYEKEGNYSEFMKLTAFIHKIQRVKCLEELDIYDNDALIDHYQNMFNRLKQKWGKIKINSNDGSFFLKTNGKKRERDKCGDDESSPDLKKRRLNDD